MPLCSLIRVSRKKKVRKDIVVLKQDGTFLSEARDTCGISLAYCKPHFRIVQVRIKINVYRLH